MDVLEAENLPTSGFVINVFRLRVELYRQEMVSVRILGEDCSCPIDGAYAACVVNYFRYSAPFPSKEFGLGTVSMVGSLDVRRCPKSVTAVALANGLFIKIGLQRLISNEASKV